MVLETTMICLDNSEWMRNGDYGLSRIEAQNNAVCNDRTGSNPENTVGILAMAGKGVELLVSPTDDLKKINACFSKVKLGGQSDFLSSVQVAQLALKHRRNKNGGQRIIAFVGSPIAHTKEKLVAIGKLLKKNNISVDVISMGELEENNEKLTEFIGAVNGDSADSSHLVSVPPGVLPVDALKSSPIFADSAYASFAGASAGAGAMGGADDLGFDPSLDPELAMAMRLSTEEARHQEEARTRAAVQESSGGNGEPSAVGAVEEMDEEEMLMQRALEMSRLDYATATESSSSSSSSSSAPAAAAATLVADVSDAQQADMDEEEALRLALEMSMVDSQEPPSTATNAVPPAPPATAAVDPAYDPAFLNSLLGSVDVDMNDPLFQAALAQLSGGALPEPPAAEDKDKGASKRKHGDDGSNKDREDGAS